MKLRIRGNSIRLRLGRSEVAQLLDTGRVVEATSFDPIGHQRLEYHLVAGTAGTVAAMLEAGNRLIIRVPVEEVVAWGRSDRIAITASQPAEAGATLRILIEKDLECLDAPPEESQADAFARPDGSLAC